MTEHLPECPLATACKHDYYNEPPIQCANCGESCICARLRACEERVRNQDIATHHADLHEAKALLASRDQAWFAGVEAAREAVAALPCMAGRGQDRHPRHVDDFKDAVLAAIGALKESK